MTDKYNLIFIVQAIIIGLLIILYGYFVYAGQEVETKAGKIRTRTSIWKTFTPKMIVLIIAASLGLSFIVGILATGTVTKITLPVAFVMVAPYVVTNNLNRIKQEDLEKDIILFCSTMCMLLRQNQNVYKSLGIAKEAVGIDLRKDIEIVMSSLNEHNKDKTIQVLKIFEKNYPYSCIRHLDIIMVQMFYTKLEMLDQTLSTFQEDISSLERDINKNKVKRTRMRIQYIGITVCCLITYYVFYKMVFPSYQDVLLNNNIFDLINFCFIFWCMISSVLVDRYFNTHLTNIE